MEDAENVWGTVTSAEYPICALAHLSAPNCVLSTISVYNVRMEQFG